MFVAKTLSIFVLAGLCEIGGGYLIWLWLKDHRAVLYGLLGGVILALYGVVATLQPAHFRKVYASYGGYSSSCPLCGGKVDNIPPDRSDVIGCAVALVGVAIVFYAPRE